MQLRSMNIGLVTEMMNIGGAAAVVLHEARWLKAHGHGVVVASSGGVLVAELEREGIPHRTVASIEPGKPLVVEQLVADGGEIARTIADFALDAIVAQAQLPFPFAAAAAQGSKVPVYLDLLSPVYFIPKTAFALNAIMQAAADGRIIAGASGAARAFAQFYGFDPLAPNVINVAIEPSPAPTVSREQMRAELGVSEETQLVITVARLDKDRAPMILPLAHAVETLAPAHKTRLLVVGDGTEAQTLKAAAPPGVIFTGFRRDLANLYAASDLFAGEGSVVQDAAAAGLPAVITCATIYPQLADRAFAIFGMQIVDHFFTYPSNIVYPVPVAEALQILLEHPQLRAGIARAGADLVARHWHIDKVMEQRLAVLGGARITGNGMSSCEAAITISGTEPGDVTALARALAAVERPERFGVRALNAVPWDSYATLPLEQVHALCKASWRMTFGPPDGYVFANGTFTPALPPAYADLAHAARR